MTSKSARCLFGSAVALGLIVTPTTTSSARTADPPAFSWELRDSGSPGEFLGLDAVSELVAWTASIDTGEVLRTVDGGATFTDVAPPDGVRDRLLFSDVEARDADEALVLSAGLGEFSRVYRTTDGGANWSETFRAIDTGAWFDCMAMFDQRRGLAVGDPVDGHFQVITTSDAGATWSYAPVSGMPDALDGEIAWVGSGTCANATGRNAWFVTGGTSESRVFRSTDYGLTWDVRSTDVLAGASGGLFAVDFRTNKVGVAIGGDYFLPEEATDALVRTTDGGRTWVLVDESVAPGGFRSGLAWWADVRGDARAAVTPQQLTIFAVGPNGSDVSTDRGKTWAKFDSGGFNSVECVGGGSLACWAVGPSGRIATLAVG